MRKHNRFRLRQVVVRLDGQYGNGAVVADLAELAYVMRGKDYDLLNLQEVQARLAQFPDQQTTHPETGTRRALFDCPDLLLTPAGPRARVIIATHPATETPAKIGTTRGETVYELFYTALPKEAFTPADIVALYLHRGAFETVLADEDQEQDPDRWCSHTAWGQEFWLILAQWIWNLRLELGHALHPTPMRTTEFAPAQASGPAEAAPDPVSQPASTSLNYLWAATVGTAIVHQRVCRSRFFFAVRWDAALSVPRSPCMHKSADQNAMARCGFCMARVSVIVALVCSASSVKNRQQPSKRDGSVRSIGLFLHLHRPQVTLLLHRRNLHYHQFLIRCSGETGSVASIGGR